MQHSADVQMDRERELRLLRGILGVSAWAIVGFFLLAVFLSLPPVEASYYARQNLPAVKVIGDALLVIMGFCAIALWGSAILHAVIRPLPARAGRTGTVVAIVCTNIFGGLVYYFFFVRRQN